jgi:uncharacterized protein
MRLISALILSTSLALPMAAFAGPGVITVTGEASVAAAPDMATISLGVTTSAATASEAMAANATAMSGVFERLKAAGIADEDTQTSNLQLNPNWNNSSSASTPEITGYTASNQVTVKVRKIESLGDVLDAAIKDGANTLNGVSFDISAPRPLQDDARKAAVEDAMARAKLLAEAAGVKLGKITAISEGGGMGNPMPMFRADSAKIPVAAGQIELSQSVTVSFEIAE